MAKTLRLEVDILDWKFNPDRSLRLDYFKKGNVCTLTLDKDQTLDYLNRAFLIDGYDGDMVTGHTTIKTVSPLGYEVEEKEYKFLADLSDFMTEMFTFDDALRLILFHEKQISDNKIKFQK